MRYIQYAQAAHQQINRILIERVFVVSGNREYGQNGTDKALHAMQKRCLISITLLWPSVFLN